ncbi:MAG: endonuclease domain-containing protein [Salinimicrobium sp.]
MENKVNNMFYGAPPVIHKQARELRKRETKAEKVLWNFISNHKLSVKFRRQHPISQFIVDFYCHELKLVIEADGEIHQEKENVTYDQMRDKHLHDLGLTVFRFRNSEIMHQTEEVVNRIHKEVARIKRNKL